VQNNFKDFSESIVGTCVYKLEIIRSMGNVLLNVFCNKIEEYLEQEKKDIVDRPDIIAFRNLASIILQLLGLLVTTKNASSRWAEPLLLEFYSQIGLDLEKRAILVAQSPEKVEEETSEGFAVYVDILSSFKAVFPEEVIPSKKIDIFVVPSEAQFDLISLAIFGHEIGHVLWKEKFQNYKTIIIKHFREYIQSEKKEISMFHYQDQHEEFFSHIQECFCDAVGRKIFDIVFDLAMLKIMCLKPDGEPGGPNTTHPPSKFRIANSFENLKSFVNGKNDEELRNYIKDFLKNFEDCHKKVEYDKKVSVLETIDELFSIPTVRNLPLCKKNIDIVEIWKKISKELNTFRPPVEVVNEKEPEIFKPTEIVIGVILYYYNSDYYEINNEFFLSSSENKESKSKKIKTILKDHLKYAISLYEFCKKAKSLFDFNANQLKHSLWDMRIRVLNKVPNALTVVPSIYPNAQYGQNSVDLRLGSYFLILKPSKYTHISPYPENISIDNFYEEVYVPSGGEFILHPHQFVLATTLEYISLPSDYYGLILGRSSWGRLGLNIATATTVQAGYRGCITLELRNLGETPLPLKIGARVAQLCLIKLPYEAEGKGYFSSKHNKYIGPTKAETTKIKKDLDWELLI
jgi:dCTP deaminase